MAMMEGQGPAMSPPPTGDGSDVGTGMSAADHIRAAIEHAQAALVGEPNDADSQTLALIVQKLYQIFAARQKQQDQTMGNPNTLQTLRGAYGP